jgi:transcriptional regulator with XRE-family HTH domain
MSNSQFAAKTGYHHTMVSRIRNGHRMPSAGMLSLMCTKLDLDHKKYLEAYREGPAVFSALLRDEVFGPKPGEEILKTDDFDDFDDLDSGNAVEVPDLV